MPPGVEPNSLIAAALILLAAALVKGTTGFGFALVATPVLLLYWEPKMMVPALLPLSIAVDVLIVAQNRQRLDWRRVAPMAVAGLTGVPLGTYVLLAAPQQGLKLGVAAVALIGGILLLSGVSFNIRRERIASGVAGFLSGLLITSTTIAGPPVTLLMINQQWPKETFRTSLGLFFLIIQAFGLATLSAAGALTAQTLLVSAILGPSVLVGYVIAVRLLPHIPQQAFLRIATIVVMTTALLAMVNALR